MLWNLLVALLMGALVGGLARALVPTGIRGGCGTSVAVGIVGAILGSVVFQFIGGIGVHDLSLYSFLVALLGAVIFLWLYRALAK
jgi:uncharacterized membrane protein YeaQ/YmgE (transglycosylase-associated protein family)